MIGFATGLTGSYTYTDAACVNQATLVAQGFYDILDEFLALWEGKSGVTILSPFYLMSDQLITLSNYGVACMIVQQANQYTLRVLTDSGFADLIYVIYNIPVEGFF